MAYALGSGYWYAFRSGVLKIRAGGLKTKVATIHRDEEPIRYWIHMAVGLFGFLVMMCGAILMAFFVYLDLAGTSK
jgi:hypothetical protein